MGEYLSIPMKFKHSLSQEMYLVEETLAFYMCISIMNIHRKNSQFTHDFNSNDYPSHNN